MVLPAHPHLALWDIGMVLPAYLVQSVMFGLAQHAYLQLVQEAMSGMALCALLQAVAVAADLEQTTDTAHKNGSTGMEI